jgi:hypothetical protein
MIKYVVIAALTLMASGCYDGRISDIERGQDYVFEAMRKRRISPEKCESFTTSKMSCTLINSNCSCTFTPDGQDEANAIYDAAVTQAAAEIKAAAAAEEARETMEE